MRNGEGGREGEGKGAGKRRGREGEEEGKRRGRGGEEEGKRRGRERMWEREGERKIESNRE